jgi:probable F420-dependent oxidoreductase
VKFSTSLPGLSRYPPDRFRTGDHWETQLTADDFQRMARESDELGFDAIACPEHLVVPRELAAGMGAFWPDAFTVMTFVAGATRRIRVNSSVIVLPYHHPVALAKAVSSLDLLSGGRVTLTFGAGMAEKEFNALGVPFHERGRVTDEYLAVLRLLWTADQPEFDGRYVQFRDVIFEPKPVQKPHPPVWIGGSSMAALRRAARTGDGWAPAGSQGGKGPWLDSVDDLPVFLAEARRQPGFEGREATFDISMGPLPTRLGPDHKPLPVEPLASTQAVIDAIGRLHEAGVTWTTVPRPAPMGEPRSLEDYLEGLQWAVEEVIPRFR